MKEIINLYKAELTEKQLLWLKEVWKMTLENGKIPEYKSLRLSLLDKLGSDFVPYDIDQKFIKNNATKITLLGALMVEFNDFILADGNTIIRYIKNKIIESPENKHFNLIDISTDLSLDEKHVRVIFELISECGSFWSGASGYPVNERMFGHKSFDVSSEWVFDNYVAFSDVSENIKKYFEKSKNHMLYIEDKKQETVSSTEFKEIIKAYCGLCHRETNHTILHMQEKEIDSLEYKENKKWQIIQCGCDDISFRTISINSDDRDMETNECVEFVEQFPLRGANIITPKPFYSIPHEIRKIYTEMIEAYNNKLLILCSAGCRATVEAICTQEKIVIGNLESKIKELHTKGILTEKNAIVLQNHRFIGNKALHYLEHLSDEDLQIAIEIIEHTLVNLYELEGKGDSLRRIPITPNFK